MSSIIDFTKNNYQWLFSGVGAALLIYGLEHFRRKRRNNSETSTPTARIDNSHSAVTANNIGNIVTIKGDSNIFNITNPGIDKIQEEIRFTNITPTSVLNDVSKSKPFERSTAGHKYHSLNVKWTLRLRGFFQQGRENSLTVQAAYEDEGIFFDINIEQYPNFRILDENAEFTIIGRIKHVSEHIITLECIDLIF